MDNLLLAKDKLRLLDLIPGPKTKKGKYYFVNPCPICGHKDHFTIIEQTNTYSSQSGCCRGGSIVDFFIETKNLSIKESINLVLEMSGLKRSGMDSNEYKLYRQKKENEKKIKIQENNIIKNYIDEVISFPIAVIRLVDLHRNIDKKEYIVNSCYGRLTRLERALREIDKKNSFLLWLYNFIENYTSRFLKTTNLNELLELCYGFKKELNYCYTEFIKYEDLINIKLLEG